MANKTQSQTQSKVSQPQRPTPSDNKKKKIRKDYKLFQPAVIFGTAQYVAKPNDNAGWETVASKKKEYEAKAQRVKMNETQKLNARVPGALYVQSATPSKKQKKKKAAPQAKPQTPPSKVQPRIPLTPKAPFRPTHNVNKVPVPTTKAQPPPPYKLADKPVYVAAQLPTPATGNIMRSMKIIAPKVPVKRPAKVVVDGRETADVFPAAMGIVKNGSWARVKEILEGRKRGGS